MDTPVTKETALDEIINFTVGNQTEFTNEGVKALVKRVVEIYNDEHPKEEIEESSLSDEEQMLKELGIEIVPIKFSKTSIDEKQFETILKYLPKLPEGQFVRVINPKGISLLKEELIKHLGEKDYKITISNGINRDGKTRLLSIRKNKKNIA